MVYIGRKGFLRHGYGWYCLIYGFDICDGFMEIGLWRMFDSRDAGFRPWCFTGFSVGYGIWHLVYGYGYGV